MKENDESTQDPQQVFRSVAQAGREAIRALWLRRGKGDELKPAERRLLALLEAHSEHKDFWEGSKEASEEHNPFLHVSLHELLEQQLDSGEPAAVGEALARLEARGVDAHEAKHEIIRALVFELAQMMNAERQFDREAYLKALDALGR